MLAICFESSANVRMTAPGISKGSSQSSANTNPPVEQTSCNISSESSSDQSSKQYIPSSIEEPRGAELNGIDQLQLTSYPHLNVFSKLRSVMTTSLRWCPTSEEELAESEHKLLSVLTQPFITKFVDIGPGWGMESNKIRTIEMLNITDEQNKDTKENNYPLVCIHGFASGIGGWILNLDAFATITKRKVYAFDILGFGRSSRAPFDLNNDVEGQFVDSIERWRSTMGIDKFILLGHSFGGYLSASYALRHPQKVSHVILADPWGVQDRHKATHNTYKLPRWVRMVNTVFQSFNPLAALRATGPYGPKLVQHFRSDLKEKFSPKLKDDCGDFLTYIYHCNAQTATGESAFKSLALPYGWPKYPLVHRLEDLDPTVSLTFIYGSRSWIDRQPGQYIQDVLGNDRVSVHIINGSGHHVYADKYEEFNELVKQACSKEEIRSKD